MGLADQVHAIADGVSDMLAKPALNAAEARQAFDVDAIFAPFAHLSLEPSGQYCPQSAFEPMLLAHIRRHGSQVRYGTELCSFEQDETGVTAVLHDRDSGAQDTVRTDYLVAADGVHSPVRDALGVPTSGHGALPMYVVFIYFRGPWRQFVPQLAAGDAIQVVNDDVNGIFFPVRDDFGMFVTTYLPGRRESAEQFTAGRCHELLRKAIGEPSDVEIVKAAPWQPYERVADQFRCGRVFLVGDSAHAMPPLKAGGANCAIQSAHNLAWKLAAVLTGTADPPLLDTYHAERHLLQREDNGPELPADEEAPMFALLIGHQYRSAAVVSDEPAPADPDSVSVVAELHGQPGTRVPHAWLSRGGQRVSTLDLLGPGFTVLTGRAGARWQAAVSRASNALGIPVVVHQIADTGWQHATGITPEWALLIRPDDFVGWRADALPADPDRELHRTLSAILARN